METMKFSITPETQTLTVVDDDNDDIRPFPRRFSLTRDLTLAPYGTIPAGAICDATRQLNGVLALKFVAWWEALRQWDNILLLFPDCVDTPILNALQAIPPKLLIEYGRAPASEFLSSTAGAIVSLIT
jgi:hypothetical protein